MARQVEQASRETRTTWDEVRAVGICEAMAQIRAGETIPAEDIEAWIKSWDSPNELPIPVPRRR